jgi:hypothetical protein
MSRARMLGGFVVVGLLVFFSQAFALQVVLTTSELAMISNPEDPLAKRVLAKYGIPECLRSAEVIYAQLEGAVNSTLGADQVTIGVQAAPLVEDWSAATVTWSAPWREPGGDAEFAGARGFLVRQGPHQVRMDVTKVVKQWASGTRQNYGLMIRMSPHSSGHISLPGSIDGDGRALPGPTIRVWYLPQSEPGQHAGG